MNQEQEEFEKFVRRTNGTWADKCLTRGPDGRYNVLQTWNDWIAWQACWMVRDELETCRTNKETKLLRHAVYRLKDIYQADDGQAWDEARKFLESIGEFDFVNSVSSQKSEVDSK